MNKSPKITPILANKDEKKVMDDIKNFKNFDQTQEEFASYLEHVNSARRSTLDSCSRM